MPFVTSTLLVVVYLIGWYALPPSIVMVGLYLPFVTALGIGYGGHPILAYICLGLIVVAIWFFLYVLLDLRKRRRT
jgi:hypothetical protein